MKYLYKFAVVLAILPLAIPGFLFGLAKESWHFGMLRADDFLKWLVERA